MKKASEKETAEEYSAFAKRKAAEENKSAAEEQSTMYRCSGCREMISGSMSKHGRNRNPNRNPKRNANPNLNPNLNPNPNPIPNPMPNPYR